MTMNRPRWILLVLGLSFLVVGVADAFVPPLRGKDYSVLDVVHAFLISALCYTWCRAEGLARGVIPPGRSALLAGVFPLLGIPVYFFRTRPWRRALVSTLGAAGFLVVGLLLAAGGTLLTESVRA
ncbi:rard protein [Variovorax sp. ZS18.2.2]|uniref:rard protein n=1 Tax=Variovorax sp. ZS18.2.2 TaxID=2971255 RepID=UPI002151C843|nr:rard protein [Variovorax sp. ZS18.2.2]MCR6476159.1 rard protein [Variovorax sp. ZS18.2.2]